MEQPEGSKVVTPRNDKDSLSQEEKPALPNTAGLLLERDAVRKARVKKEIDETIAQAQNGL